jgi:hypothetical protein
MLGHTIFQFQKVHTRVRIWICLRGQWPPGDSDLYRVISSHETSVRNIRIIICYRVWCEFPDPWGRFRITSFEFRLPCLPRDGLQGMFSIWIGFLPFSFFYYFPFSLHSREPILPRHQQQKMEHPVMQFCLPHLQISTTCLPEHCHSSLTNSEEDSFHTDTFIHGFVVEVRSIIRIQLSLKIHVSLLPPVTCRYLALEVLFFKKGYITSSLRPCSARHSPHPTRPKLPHHCRVGFFTSVYLDLRRSLNQYLYDLTYLLSLNNPLIVPLQFPL